MGKHYPKMQCSVTISALSIFGAKIKIALTGVRSSVRKVLVCITDNQILLTLYFLLKLTHFLVKKCFPTIYKINRQNHDTIETSGTYLYLPLLLFIALSNEQYLRRTYCK